MEVGSGKAVQGSGGDWGAWRGLVSRGALGFAAMLLTRGFGGVGWAPALGSARVLKGSNAACRQQISL